MKYCSACAAPVEWRIPDGDNLPRHVCPECNVIYYSNPKIIVGSIPIWQKKKVLLCRRAIEPRSNFWTVPSGFMENNETTQEGALRETREEANAEVSIGHLHTLYNIPHISQVYLLFKAELLSLDFSPGPESLEVRLFTENEIPWEKIAFSTVHYSLKNIFLDMNNAASLRQVMVAAHYGCYPANA